ncbi:MAG: hypothetical protein ACRDRW_05330 [Pseudonocardiaceae bacterium]
MDDNHDRQTGLKMPQRRRQPLGEPADDVDRSSDGLGENLRRLLPPQSDTLIRLMAQLGNASPPPKSVDSRDVRPTAGGDAHHPDSDYAEPIEPYEAVYPEHCFCDKIYWWKRIRAEKLARGYDAESLAGRIKNLPAFEAEVVLAWLKTASIGLEKYDRYRLRCKIPIGGYYQRKADHGELWHFIKGIKPIEGMLERVPEDVQEQYLWGIAEYARETGETHLNMMHRLVGTRGGESVGGRSAIRAFVLRSMYDLHLRGFIRKCSAFVTDPAWSVVQASDIMRLIHVGLVAQVGDGASATYQLTDLGVQCAMHYEGDYSKMHENSHRTPTIPPPTSITIGSVNGGQVNIAEIVSNLDTSINSVASQGAPGIAGALWDLKRSILLESTLDDSSRAELLDNLDDLADAAKKSPQERKRGRVKAALDVIQTVAVGAVKVGETWEKWEPIITSFFINLGYRRLW